MKLTFLRSLYSGAESYVSVYLDTDRAHENAAEAIALRWRAARHSLAEAGADPQTLDAAERVVTDPGQAAPGCAVFASAGEVRFAIPLNDPPRQEIARLAPLPHVVPLLAQQPPRPPHLLVTATHAGGEIMAVTGSGEVVRELASGRGWPVHKTKAGGWSQARYQRSAEEAWEENAKELAAAVAEAANGTHPELIIIAGDVRARSLLLDHLATPLADRAIIADREVAVDSPAMAGAAEAAMSARAGSDTRQRYDEWRAERERSRAVEGLKHTLAALREGQVSGLFLADDPTAAATAWIGPGGTDVAAEEAELRDWGVAEPVRDRADAAIARALAFTDADLHFLPGDLVVTRQPGSPDGIDSPRDGICATLRWADNT